MKQPNLLYVFADQWRYQAMGCHGADQAETPHMDRFASESMRFTNACSTFPLCSPHRASLMTGKYPFSVGMWTNCKIGLEEKIMLKPQETCIANVLKAHGYQTGYIGKWHLDASEMNFSAEPESGARNWDAYTPPGERRQGFDFWLSYGADDHHLDPHYWMDSATMIKPGKWSAEFETDQAIGYMEERRKEDRPFALFLSYNPPHLPYELVPDCYYDRFRHQEIAYRPNVPEDLREGILKTQTRQYFAAVAGIDEQFGRITEYLREHDLEEDTIVVLSADHGEMLGSHGLMSKNVWYEESIHIPLMIRQKGRIPAVEQDVIFASPDHMPTLLGLLDIPVPSTCQGYDHTPGLLGKPWDGPEDMFLCSFPGGADMVREFERRGLNHKAYGWRGIRDKRYTYVITNGYAPDDRQEEFLYDHDFDPYEMNPLMAVEDMEYEGVFVKCRERLRQYLADLEDPFLIERPV